VYQRERGTQTHLTRRCKQAGEKKEKNVSSPSRTALSWLSDKGKRKRVLDRNKKTIILEDTGHGHSTVNSIILALGKKCKVAQIVAEGLRFPAKEMLNLSICAALRVEKHAGNDMEGMG
jgi:hypothetical protein